MWQDSNGVYYHTDYDPIDTSLNKTVRLYAPSGSMSIEEFDDVIHGKCGWIRLFPHVEYEHHKYIMRGS